jgi:peroxiredoxin
MNKINECIEAVDLMLEKSIQNDDIYHYTLEFLLDYFEKSHNQDAIAYLSDHYLESGCKNKELAMELANKQKILESLSVGQLAPAISLNDPSGQVKHLNTVDARLTLVYFWDSQCPHCIDAIHQLYTLYQSYKSGQIDFYAVSLDKQKENWTETLDKYEMPWNHVCTRPKNRKTIMQTYNIKSIPMYYLLDKDKRILLKSQSLRSIKLKINKILTPNT